MGRKSLSLGFSGTPGEWRRLERAISVMAIVIIPLAVSVHTVVSWIFSMILRAAWHSAIFGPYFVVGAIFSGIAALLTAMAVFVRLFPTLQRFITLNGAAGKGDGPAAKGLTTKPGDLPNPKVWSETDGELSRKITEAKKPCRRSTS